jgi:hypothetical protein
LSNLNRKAAAARVQYPRRTRLTSARNIVCMSQGGGFSHSTPFYSAPCRLPRLFPSSATPGREQAGTRC